MSLSFDDTKQRVKEAIDIVDLVGRYIQLRRQGRGYVGLCPWHNDSRPSLQINPERQTFKCWVCDIGGDVFTFAMKMEGVEFREALAMLADQAGVALEERGEGRGARGEEKGSGFRVQERGERGEGRGSRGEGRGEREQAGGKRRLFQAMAWAEGKYHDCLVKSPEAEQARKYLRERGITDESITKFHLGFSPNRSDWLLRLAEEAKANTSILETVGILARRDVGERPYDRFRGRLLFSIRDPQDRPIALGGRVLPESGTTSPAKYINSPETPLFRKSKTLYGLDLAKHAMRKDRTAVVMEGYTDCIVAHQCGFQNAVAVLGTALGEDHIRTLAPFADRIVLVLDGDEAGQRRASEVLGLFVAKEVNLQIVTLPEGLDPADFLLEHGAEAFADVLEHRALDALEHAFQAATRGVDLDGDVHAATQALERLLAVVAGAPRLSAQTTQVSQLRQEKMLERLAFKFRVPEADVRQRLTALRKKIGRRESRVESRESREESRESRVESRESRVESRERDAAGVPSLDSGLSTLDSRLDPWQRELLEILVRHPECLGVVRSKMSAGWLSYVPGRRIYETCLRLDEAGESPTFDRLMLELDDPALKSLLVELDEGAIAKGVADPAALLEELIRNYEAYRAQKRYAAEAGALRQGPPDEAQVLAELVRQHQGRHGISEPMDG